MQFSDPMRHRLTLLLGEVGAVLIEIATVVAVQAIALLAAIAVLVALIMADVLAAKHAFTLSGLQGTVEQALVLIVNITIVAALFRAFHQRPKFKKPQQTDYFWEEQLEEVEISSDQDNWWTVLGVSPEASLNDIRRNYIAKIQQYHPDRVAGLAPTVREMAETRSKRLNAAYAEAMRERRASP